MPHEPYDPQREDAQRRSVPRDVELDHVVRNLFDVELEQLAFARPRTAEDERKADAAARELARRVAHHASRMGDDTAVGTGAATAAAAESGARSAPGRVDAPAAPRPVAVRDPDDRPWWTRTAAIVAAGILVVVGATTIGPMLPTNPGSVSSLDVFQRSATTEERDLQSDLLRDGLRVSSTPRIIAEEPDALFVAYRVVVTSTVERARSEICVLLAEAQGLGWPSCTDRAEFERSGLQTTLTGQSTRYILQWGPLGPPRVTVLSDAGATPGTPQSAAAERFFAEPPQQDEAAYAGLLRSMYPDDRLLVRMLATTDGWEVVGALVASADTELWSYCVHLFQDDVERRAQLGASVTCAGLEAFEREGLVAQASAPDSTLRLEWQPDGTVRTEELAHDGGGSGAGSGSGSGSGDPARD